MFEEGQVLETHYIAAADADVIESQDFYVSEVLPWRLMLLQRDFGVAQRSLHYNTEGDALG